MTGAPTASLPACDGSSRTPGGGSSAGEISDEPRRSPPGSPTPEASPSPPRMEISQARPGAGGGRRIKEGYDIVCGWRKDRKDPWLTGLPLALRPADLERYRYRNYGAVGHQNRRAEVVRPIQLPAEDAGFSRRSGRQINVCRGRRQPSRAARCLEMPGFPNHRVISGFSPVKFLQATRRDRESSEWSALLNRPHIVVKRKSLHGCHQRRLR